MIEPKAKEPASVTDGRRERSRSSRTRIVSSLLKLVAEGTVSPSAAQVAETAGVGLRSVFRHFEDMDSLYREMSEAIEEQVTDVLVRPFTSEGWRNRLFEMAERRASIFEIILPYRISAEIKRFESPYLMQDYRRLIRMERSALEAVLPPELLADEVRTRSIGLTLSFQSWRALRHDEGLNVDDAHAVIVRILKDILAQIEL